MLTAIFLLAAAIALPPAPQQYVTDRAGVMPEARRAALNEKLAAFERQTSDQIIVYIDQRLPPATTLEEMSAEAIRHWGVGQKGKDNGAILFVFIGDRKMRVETGYGLEGSLTDAKAKWITSNVIKPEFRRGDYAAGIEHGVDAILATIRGEHYQGSGRTVAESQAARDTITSGQFAAYLLLMLLAIPTLVVAAIGLAYYTLDRPFAQPAVVATLALLAPAGTLILLGFIAARSFDAVVAFGKTAAIVFAVLLFAGYCIGLALALLARIASGVKHGQFASYSPGLWGSGSSSSSGSSGSSSSSSSSSSGFSGGGGSGGGGGASDSW